MADLSILIPARNEEFLAATIKDITEKMCGDTEVIAVLDGLWANPPIEDHPKVTLVYLPKSIGQRAATNLACKLSNAKYIMKVDAHCIFDEGFDVKLMEDMHDDWTMVPQLRHVHAFNWRCKKCGNEWYQGPVPKYCCKGAKFGNLEDRSKNPECDNTTDFERKIYWQPKRSPKSNHFRFDNTLHFAYWRELGKRPGFDGELSETMSIQGSCFIMTREKYWELNICDEAHGSWGQQGVEVACKTWLSGGKVMSSRKTWYAHLFRTQAGFGFPYQNNSIEQAREFSRDLWFSPLPELQKKFPQAIYDLQWLLNKFGPVPGWDVSKGVVYYTCNTAPEEIMRVCQNRLKRAIQGKRLVSVSREPLDFGENIHLPGPRGYLQMFKQILAGIEALDTDIVFLAEHDVMYHKSHFDFTPPEIDKFYYNTNVWKVRYEDGHAMRTADMKQVSGLCAYRDLMLRHYRKRVKLLEDAQKNMSEEEFNRHVRKMGFEPGTHGREERVDNNKAEGWESSVPNVDIRHGENLTASRWSPDQFRNKKYTEGWQESDEVPGWGRFKDFFV